MYLLKNIGIVHNAILHILHRLFFIVQITCTVAMFLLFPISYAHEKGATIFTVPVTAEDFPDGQEERAALLHHKTGLKTPCLYKYKVLPHCKNAMQLTPRWLKNYYGALPLFFVKKNSEQRVQLSQSSLSQTIELIESDECKDDVSFVSLLNKNIADTLETSKQLLFPCHSLKKSSVNLLEHESFLCPLNYEEKKVPVTLPISFNLWQEMSKLHLNANNTKRQLSYIHKKLQFTFDKASLTLPTHVTYLEVSNKHHVEHLHQNMLHISSIIVQTYGKQKIMLMPPISEQHPYPHWLDLTGQFFLNKEIDLSASNNVLNNESRLAHATFYSVDLHPGDMLLVPANWFIYQKSLSTSISLSLNYLSGDKWRFFCFQAEPREQKHEHNHEYHTLEKRTVTKWANTEMQQNPHNKYYIIQACKRISNAISDTTQQVLDLSYLELSSLPDAIFRIPHLQTLDLEGNNLTSFSLHHVKNLVSLNLACNALTSFSLSHMKNLVSLNLTCNRLTYFSLSHMENLTSLDLSYNHLNSFLICDLPKVTNITLYENCLAHLDPTCISFINTSQLTTFDLRNNPWSLNAMTQIYRNLSQRLKNNVINYPDWFFFITYIQRHAITYENFLHLLSHNNTLPSSENNCLQCPITCNTPHLVIFLMTSNKHYILYDADALIQWIYTQSQSQFETSHGKIQDPSTREPLTLKNIISATQQPVLEYLKQKLEPVSTDNMGLIHDCKNQKNVESSDTDIHHSNHFISFFTQHLNELNKKLENITKNLIFIQTVVRVIKNKLHECLNTQNVITSTKTLLTSAENRATYMFAEQEDNNVTVLLNFLKSSQENITDCALPLLQKEYFNINTGPIDIISQSTMDDKTLRKKRNQLFIKQLYLLTPPCLKEGNRSICTPVITRVNTDFSGESFESIQWEKKVSEIPKQIFSSALMSTTQPMIKYLESIQKLLEHKIKISCDRLHKIATKIKPPIKAKNDQDASLFKKIHVMLCAEDTSKHYLVEMYMTGVRIVLFIHNMKKNIDHILYRLQAYRSDIKDVDDQQTMLDAAQKLEHHFEHQRHAIKEKSALFKTPLLDEPSAMFPDNIHWTQEELDEQLKNFARITWID